MTVKFVDLNLVLDGISGLNLKLVWGRIDDNSVADGGLWNVNSAKSSSICGGGCWAIFRAWNGVAIDLSLLLTQQSQIRGFD